MRDLDPAERPPLLERTRTNSGGLLNKAKVSIPAKPVPRTSQPLTVGSRPALSRLDLLRILASVPREGRLFR
jgi:hypothetical protein